MNWVDNTLWHFLKVLWNGWGIEILVAVSLVCQTILALLGGRRKNTPLTLLRLTVWAAYLLGTYVATLALGKLTVIHINNPQNPGYIVELQGLLAPLLLMQVGYPDAITAYAVEDNRIGPRQILNIGATIVFVVWVLSRCWDTKSPVSWLYFPLFVVGIIKSVGWVLALKSVYEKNSSVTAEDIDEEAELPRLYESLPAKLDSAKTILKAYHRFDVLKPHLVNWLYHPVFTTKTWMSIDEYTPELAFTTTEIELSFMYDVLYTKAPVLYTLRGLLGRFISFLCLVSTLCGFALIFKNAFLIDMHVTYTYTMLVAVTSLELYQIMLLPLSDWAVVKMLVHYNRRQFVRYTLPKLAKWCMKRKKWSRSIGKLNLLDYRLYEEWPKPIGSVLWLFGKDEIFRRYWLSSSRDIPLSLKVLVVQAIRKLETKRKLLPFTERGNWTLESYDRHGNEELKRSIVNPNTFDRSIIIWHIATEICYSFAREESDVCHGSKLLSDYMMYLLAMHPYMLSTTTANITLEHACSTVLKPFVRHRGEREALRTLWSKELAKEPDMDDNKATLLTRGWNVLTDVQNLVSEMRRENDKWELISSMWVEMLCYAAYNCTVYQHANMLRQGGELITHAWLLLVHMTDKYHSGLDLTEDSLPIKPQSPKRKNVCSCLPNLCA